MDGKSTEVARLLVAHNESGGLMQVGDLIHCPRYPFWGMGVVLEVGRPQDGLLIHWFDNDETTWTMKVGLEKL